MQKKDFHILIVTAGYKPAWIYGGPTYSIASLAEALITLGIKITVLTTNANGKNDFSYSNKSIRIVDGVEVIYCHRLTGDPISFSPAHTRVLLNRIKEFDLIHIQGWWNWVSIISLFICKLYRVPHVLSPRGALSEYTFQTPHTKRIKKWLHKLLFKGILNKTILHVTSKEEAMKFMGVVPDASFISIPNIVPMPGQSIRTTEGHKPLKLVFLGRLNLVKNLELLILALNKVDFKYTLSIAGEGDPVYKERLRLLINGNHQIQMIGPVFDEAKFTFLGNADLLVLLSHTENFGNVVIEALSQGTAVLLSENVGSADFVKENDLGWIVSPDLDVCTDTLNSINTSRCQLERIRKRAPEIIKSVFNPSTLAERYVHECYSMANPAFKHPNKISSIE